MILFFTLLAKTKIFLGIVDKCQRCLQPLPSDNDGYCPGYSCPGE